MIVVFPRGAFFTTLQSFHSKNMDMPYCFDDEPVDDYPQEMPPPTFVDTEQAQSFDCGICLHKINNAVAVDEDQLLFNFLVYFL